MEEKCFFCDDIALKSVGNKFICESCISEVYSLLKRDVEDNAKYEIEHNRETIKVIKEICEELSRIKGDISEIKRRIR